MKRFFLILFVSAIFCTGLSWFVKYEYCMSGDGRGFPFAMTHPGHGPAPLELEYDGQAIEGTVFDIISFGLNLITWSILVGLPLAVFDGRKNRRKLNQSSNIPIGEIKVDDAGRLLVMPVLPRRENFEFIYRAAMEIRWDQSSRCLVSPSPQQRGWSYVDWFRQTLQAVANEYGVKLQIGPWTKWSVSDAVRNQIEEWWEEQIQKT